MHPRRAALSLALMIAALWAPAPASAHGGGLDRNGGHHDRRNGGYHCHRDPCREPTVDRSERETGDNARDQERQRGRGRARQR